MRKRCQVALLSIFLNVATFYPSSAQSHPTLLKNLSHIHHLEAYGSKVLLGTHDGLYEYLGKGEVRTIGSSKEDFMGLTSDGSKIFMSGHPGFQSKLPNPIGLMESINNGRTWESVSLKGQVDFHLLESANGEIYGVDSGSGNLFHSEDFGNKWNIIGENKFSDIALSPTVKNSALALIGNSVRRTNNSFKDSVPLKVGINPDFVEWSGAGIYLASKKKIIFSKNNGKSWQTLRSFSGQIVALSVSEKLIVVAVDGLIYISRNAGKSFLRF